MAVLVHLLVDNFLGFSAPLQLGDLGRAVLDLGVVVDFFDLQLHLQSGECELARLAQGRGFLLADYLGLLRFYRVNLLIH